MHDVVVNQFSRGGKTENYPPHVSELSTRRVCKKRSLLKFVPFLVDLWIDVLNVDLNLLGTVVVVQ